MPKSLLAGKFGKNFSKTKDKWKFMLYNSLADMRNQQVKRKILKIDTYTN
jgi:hypothetical protein